MAEDDAAPPVRVLVVSDPGQPSRRVRTIRDLLEQSLHRDLAASVSVQVRTEVIRLRSDDSLDLAEVRRLGEERDRMDAILLLTEIPRHHGGKMVVGEIFPGDNVAVISTPALGPWAGRRRVVRLLASCVTHLVNPDRERVPDRNSLRWTRWAVEGAQHQVLYASSVFGGARAVLGMVTANDPLRTAPRMSSALAAASATGAFGIFYNSIWQMSNYLSLTRLLLIGFLAMSAMVFWLIASNGLWDRPQHGRLASVVLLYNLSTVVTLFLCVFVLYAALLLLILGGSLVIIDPEFMTDILGTEATFVNYLDIAWLSAAMGVIAGGLGSSFDSRTDLRRLTHGQRERQRRLPEADEEEL